MTYNKVLTLKTRIDKFEKLPSTREQAKLEGSLVYYNKKKCNRGHVSPRYISNYLCLVCAKEYQSKHKAAKYNELNRKKLLEIDKIKFEKEIKEENATILEIHAAVRRAIVRCAAEIGRGMNDENSNSY